MYVCMCVIIHKEVLCHVNMQTEMRKTYKALLDTDDFTGFDLSPGYVFLFSSVFAINQCTFVFLKSMFFLSELHIETRLIQSPVTLF